MACVPAVIELTDEEEGDLRQVLKSPSARQEQAMRARIVLRAAEGASNTEIAAGEVTGACYLRRAHQEFLGFVNTRVGSPAKWPQN